MRSLFLSATLEDLGGKGTAPTTSSRNVLLAYKAEIHGQENLAHRWGGAFLETGRKRYDAKWQTQQPRPVLPLHLD